MKLLKTIRNRALKYFSKHPEFNALTHAFGGIAIGILIATPFTMPHPVRWALFFAALSILGHLYTLVGKK